ncbi:hypothetical protein HKX48_009086 [Thoreauomyces humboldtii]|nr:hypothetical protein HKX48_009086 [Thoreauomyces humboldtii]
MGGGGKYPYPQWVWSYYGGWWSQPKNVVSNTIVTGLGVATLVALAWNVSANREVRYWPYLLSLLLADSVGRAYYHARATEISAGEGQICGKASSEDVLWELGYCGLPVAEAEEVCPPTLRVVRTSKIIEDRLKDWRGGSARPFDSTPCDDKLKSNSFVPSPDPTQVPGPMDSFHALGEGVPRPSVQGDVGETARNGRQAVDRTHSRM